MGRLKGINELKQEEALSQLIKSKKWFGSLFRDNNNKHTKNSTDLDAHITLLSFPYECGLVRDKIFRKSGMFLGPGSLKRFIYTTCSISNPQLSDTVNLALGKIEVFDAGKV